MLNLELFHKIFLQNDKIKNVSSFIQLPGNDDSESLNLIILNILILIKFIYYRKYVIK